MAYYKKRHVIEALQPDVVILQEVAKKDISAAEQPFPGMDRQQSAQRTRSSQLGQTSQRPAPCHVACKARGRPWT